MWIQAWLGLGLEENSRAQKCGYRSYRGQRPLAKLGVGKRLDNPSTRTSMLVSFFEDIADDGYSNLGMALGMLDDGYGPSDRHYVRIFQPSDACDPVSHMRTSAAQNIVVWHTKPLC